MDQVLIMEQALSVTSIAMRLGLQKRATLHQDGKIPESVTTHTVMLGLVMESFIGPLRLRADYVHRYVLVHDLVEAIVGDTDTLGIKPDERKAKEQREREALEALRHSALPPWIVYAIDRYEEQVDPEARAVRYLDKVLPKLTHALNNCAAIRAKGWNAERLHAEHEAQRHALAEEYPDLAPILDPVFKQAADYAVRVLRDIEQDEGDITQGVP